ILEAAVSNMDGTREFSAAPWDFSMGRLSPGGEIVVPSIALDSCIYGEKRFHPPEVIKIDVEGAELEVLLGGSRTFTEFHPLVFLEVHGTQLHADCRDFLTAKGYRVEERYGQIRGAWEPTV